MTDQTAAATTGGDTTDTSRQELRRRAGHLARRALQLEVAGYLSIYRFVFRRPRVPPGAVAFTYHQPVSAVFAVLVAVSAFEVVAVDIITRPWPMVRIPLLVLGVWGLVWMLGMLLGFVTRPHSVGPDGIRVRHGAEIEIVVAWDDIDAIARRKRAVEGRPPQWTTDADGGVILHLPVQDATAIDIVLARPLDVRLPQRAETITEVRLAVDEPRAFFEAARPYLT